MNRTIPSCWRKAGESGTKQLYQQEKPVVYIVPITSILGRLPLIPAGGHCTIPDALRGSKRDLFLLGTWNVMRTGCQALAAGSSTSARGPCADLLTTPKKPKT